MAGSVEALPEYFRIAQERCHKFNSACSLAVAMTFLVPSIIVPGINSLFLVRYLFEKYATIKEAIQISRITRFLKSANI